MIVLDVQYVSKHFGRDAVLDGVTFQVHPGERVALVGPNGCGKSTLLRIIAGKEEADAGSATLHPSVHAGSFEQQVHLASAQTVYEEAKSALADLILLQEEAVAVAEAMAEAGEDDVQRLAARYDHLQQELARRDAYNLDHKVKRVLDGLGFPETSFRQPVESLSGGEQNRLMLAKLLLAEPNLMLLDEPSNHLDIEATQWLEEFLVESSAAVIVVSHDRSLLDRVATHTLELVHGTVDTYTGNFSAYWRQKQERLLVERRTYEKQQTEIAKAEEFIRRNAYGQKHAQAEDRRKKLERIEPVPLPREIAAPPMAFPAASRSGDVVVRTERLGKSFDKPLFSDVAFDICRGERWGLLGPNGCGKTTLLKCLVGLIEPDQGRPSLGHGVKVGYFDQHLYELHDDMQAVDAVRPPRGSIDIQTRRNLLGRFGLTGDTQLQPVGKLSGGERCRVALARLCLTEANLLVLDEPTNHLDLWARDALEQALLKFDGTVLFVSHDRYFVNRVADHLLVMESGRVRIIEGNYDAYQRAKASQEAPSPAAEPGEPSPDRRRQPSAPPAESNSKQRRRRFPFRKVADLEAEILQRETELERIHAELADGATHRDGELVRQLKGSIEEQKSALAALYEHWEEAVELNW
ncbi:MAG: ABC-F family ATP-binding cassette domain-containing protein [Thermoguttaceae bacterium]|jgi:ATP-binding cassette subfamily F protein 3|nr:ABC-F family ATP-binding cassette domain-containing protein [Thermoguttaceae bacterium]